jgi:hypothetical protein
MSNVIYPNFGDVQLRDGYWDELEELLDQGCDFDTLNEWTDDPDLPDAVLLAECMSLLRRVLRSAFRAHPGDDGDQCNLVFLDAVASAAGWSAGCCDDPALAARLVEIARLAGGE